MSGHADIRPLVSCIIIFLNEARFLDEAVRSVLAQTYDRWELMLVDDGSTDASSDIARRYAEAHPARIRYLEHPNHENRGMSASRNLGFRHTRGPYIALLDGDDVWLPNKLTNQVAILDAHPEVAMTYGRTRYWYGWTRRPEHRRRNWWTPLGVEPNQVVAPPALVTNFLRDENTVVSNCSALVRREAIEEVGGWEDSFRTLYEDMVLWTKILSRRSAYVSDGSWDLYRQHPGNSAITAALEGIWDPRGPNLARRVFLEWVVEYTRQQSIADADLLDAVNAELKPYLAPPPLLVQRVAALRQQVTVAAGNVSERIRASEFAQAVRAHPTVCRWLGPIPDYPPPPGYALFGDLRQLAPVGHDRGGRSIHRRYVERFIDAHASDISGRVLEIGDGAYSSARVARRVTRREVWHTNREAADSDNPGTPAWGEGVASCLYDCIMCVDALAHVYNVEDAARTLFRVLKPGGVLLVCLPGSAAHRAPEGGAIYWRFTEQSARLLFERCCPEGAVHVSAQGNVLTSVAMLEGLGVTDLDTRHLDVHDRRYPLVVSVRAVKSAALAPGETREGTSP